MGINTSWDYTTVKYNTAGVEQWVVRYNGPVSYADVAEDVAVDDQGNVYVTGSIGISSNGQNIDYGTIKYNSAGVEQWVATYNGPENGVDRATALVLDANENVYVTGSNATVMYNSNGEEQWATRYLGTDSTGINARSIALDDQGNVYVTGVNSEQIPLRDYVTIKYNSQGVEQWAARYNGPGNYEDSAFDIVVDSKGNAYVTGGSAGTSFDLDFTTIKYNSEGVEQWLERYNEPGSNSVISWAIAIDSQDNLYITGLSYGTGTSADFTTIKYSQTSTSIQNTSNESIDNFSLTQNYPNPFNPTTKISWQSPVGGWQALRVYDVLGNEVSTLVDEYKPAGSYEVEFNASGLSSGIYFYQLTTGNFKETKKMILLQ